jgi:hypothetical protein
MNTLLPASLTEPTPDTHLPPSVIETMPHDREQQIRALLDPAIEIQGNTYGYGNYEFAKDTGLIDMFYFNPTTGEDGVLHTLSGIEIKGRNGERVLQGFHHEPSAQAIWPVSDQEGLSPTRVDRRHLEQLNSKKRYKHREFPYEPYKAKVYIDNAKKLTEEKNPETGEVTIVETNNGMFPKEYDALAVLQSIRQAYNNRVSENSTQNHDGSAVRVIEGYAPMLDGKSLMKLRIVLDPESDKIRSAMPVDIKPGAMKLSEVAIAEHLGIRALN